KDRRADVLAEERVDPLRHAEGTGVDLGAEPAAEAAEDVAAHADRGRDQDDQSGERGERVGDRSEREPGYEIAARGDEERDEAGADSGEVRAHERDEPRADETREAKQSELGGSNIRRTSGEATRLPRFDHTLMP